MKNYPGRGGVIRQDKKALADDTSRDLHNVSYLTEAESDNFFFNVPSNTSILADKSFPC